MKRLPLLLISTSIIGFLPTLATSGWCVQCVTQNPCALPPISEKPFEFCGVWDDGIATCVYWEKRELNCGFGFTGWEYRGTPMTPGSCIEEDCL